MAKKIKTCVKGTTKCTIKQIASHSSDKRFPSIFGEITRSINKMYYSEIEDINRFISYSEKANH